MNTEEIFDLIKSDREISKRFMEMYPIDLIPHNLPIPCVIIVNLESSEKKSSHWIVLHFQRKHVEYFDSLGKEPAKSIHNLLTSKGFIYKYNKKGYNHHIQKAVVYFASITVITVAER